MQTKKRKIL